MLKRTEGVVIKTQDYGETHKIVTLFTKELGKLSAISRGASKPKSRLNATAQLFVKAEYLIYVSSGLSTIQQGEIVTSFRNIQTDIEKTAYASLLAEITYHQLEMKQPDIYLYDQFIKTLDWLNNNDEFMIPLMMYEMKMYDKGGFAPIVDQCVNCGDRDSLISFSIQEGGVLCDRCSSLDPRIIRLTPSLVRILQIFLHVNIEQIGNVRVRKENEQRLRQILDAYYEHFGGYPLKSKQFIRQLNDFK